MDKHRLDLFNLYLPEFGDCTILPQLEKLPQRLRNYHAIWQAAKTQGLEEFPELSLSKIQELYKCLSLVLSSEHEVEGVDIRVLISGVHNAYASIDVSNPHKPPGPCVTCLILRLWYKKNMFNVENPYTKYFEMVIDEVPVHEPNNLAEFETLYCLFVGST